MGLILLRKIKRLKKKTKSKEMDEKNTDYLDPRKTKIVVEFNHRESTSIKFFVV